MHHMLFIHYEVKLFQNTIHTADEFHENYYRTITEIVNTISINKTERRTATFRGVARI